jgi:hypothetical protein
MEKEPSRGTSTQERPKAKNRARILKKNFPKAWGLGFDSQHYKTTKK